MIDSSLNTATISMQQGATSVQELRQLAGQDEHRALEEATKQFEGLFIQMMLKTMRSTVGEDMFSSSATQTFKDMQDTEMAKQIAAAGGIGLTQQVIDSVMRQAGVEQAGEMEPQQVESATQDTLSYLQNRVVE